MTEETTKNHQRFETFVMTGDTIIKTRSILHGKPTSHLSYETSTSSSNFVNNTNASHFCEDSKYAIASEQKNSGVSVKKTLSTANHSLNANCKNMHNNGINNMTSPHFTLDVPLLDCYRNYSADMLELDIPPDDISFEDEQYGKTVDAIDIDHLPQPPEDFFMPTVMSNVILTPTQISKLNDINNTGNDFIRHKSCDSFTQDVKVTNMNMMNYESGMNFHYANRAYKSQDNYLQFEDGFEFKTIIYEEAGAISIDALNSKKADFSCSSLDRTSSGLSLNNKNINNEKGININNSGNNNNNTINSNNNNNNNNNITDGTKLNANNDISDLINNANIDKLNNLDLKYIDNDSNSSLNLAKHQTCKKSSKVTNNFNMASTSEGTPKEQVIKATPPMKAQNKKHADDDDNDDDNNDDDGQNHHLGNRESVDMFPSNSLSRTSKDADHPSAQRLAKRLFNLDGFQKTDVAKHLGKKDSFSNLVGQEYSKNFDFTGMKLDEALRHFLTKVTLIGETQERERVLAHFSHRFVECNPDFVLSDDSCHTLICAMMLLNTDHCSQSVSRKMTQDEFVDNLSLLNDGQDFPKDLLKQLYNSVCKHPFECHVDDNAHLLLDDSIMTSSSAPSIGPNPFLHVPDLKHLKEFKRGYVMRKCCVDSDGHKTSMGRRGWRMFYATIRDTFLFLYKDEHSPKRSDYTTAQHQHSNNSAIRLHHAFAEKAEDYLKKQHVFRLYTSDSAQYLFQTRCYQKNKFPAVGFSKYIAYPSDSSECSSWMTTINLVAAMLSSAPLPGAVGSQKKFQRPLMPCSISKLSLPDQLKKFQQVLSTIEEDLSIHRHVNLPKGTKANVLNDHEEKERFLMFELKKFTTYCNLLKTKLQQQQQQQQHASPSTSVTLIGMVIEEASPSLSQQDNNNNISITTNSSNNNNNSNNINNGNDDVTNISKQGTKTTTSTTSTKSKTSTSLGHFHRSKSDRHATKPIFNLT